MHFISRNIVFILKVEYSISSVVRIYFHSIIVNLLNTPFTISIMTEYIHPVTCRFAFDGNVYKVYYRWCYLLIMINTSYI